MQKYRSDFKTTVAKITKKDLLAILTKDSWPTLLRCFGYLLVAFFFYGSQLLAPLHVPIAWLLVFLAFRAIYRFLSQRQIARGISELSRHTWRQLIAYRLFFIGAVFLIFSGYTYVSLVPTDQSVFSGQSTEEVSRQVTEDTVKAAQIIDLLTVTGDSLLEIISKLDTEVSISPQAQDEVQKAWNDFLGVAIASEEITDRHRYFSQISFWRERELQVQSFTISYALYMKKFAYFHQVIDAVGLNSALRTILNEYSSAFGGINSYVDVTNRYFATNSFLRRNAGYMYYLLLAPKIEPHLAPEYVVILTAAKASYHYLASNLLSHFTHRGLTMSFSFSEGVSEAWLPIQKTVFVDTVGNIHLGNRTSKFITLGDIESMKVKLAPGDIFVARKNWYASNVGIPGFWTHVGIYTGTLQNMEEYFGELFPYSYLGITYNSLAELLQSLYPNAYLSYTTQDESGFMPAVIESETRGTRIQSIEYSARVDYFGVMRPNLNKEIILKSLLRAFSHQGKPYDYEFNLLTKTEFFCSELVFDAYAPRANQAGINFPRTTVNGRELVAPNDIVLKYATTPVSESGLSFVYFLDGNEETGEVVVASENAFKASYLRPKFSFLQQ